MKKKNINIKNKTKSTKNKGIKKSINIRKVLVSTVLAFFAMAVLYSLVLFFVGGSNDPLPLDPSISTGVGDEAETTEVMVYFSKNKGSDSITEGVIRKIPKEFDALSINYALEALLEGPSEGEQSQGYFSEIPMGTKLIEVTQIPGELRVNLTRQFISGGGSHSMQQRINQLTGTIRSIEKAIPVFIDIEGKQLDLLGGEGVMVKEPVNQGNSDPR